ncbi:protein disulfide-isomerase, putative [Plasmodium yoelii]|uniref:Protein disulfide-isomerase n=2 Tax=Plasmodium yoelii TaxID=5861 RepID=A0AAE9X1G7_PLAYO|nr:protein disulfide-isomerase, putative [Plasmodium yoelii]WBY60113.1 protein disulfide-isomerase [Plasmodium yoelii yoelii]CDU20025.1 protein disulfide-isomerase, putative [Plasmodium yoelii]VTZ80783.1 protein disulfide-isomerase, putative [Plasmodium yoelii]|eukprot:XP_022813648.1 protein disulfide-isomerase, putative [Plasmodium yoelii]
MKYINLLIPFFILINFYYTGQDNLGKKEIVSINMDTFNQILEDEDQITLLIVYTHWCQRSILLLENLENISSILMYDSNINISKINVAINHEIIHIFDVYSYPSLFLIKKKQVYKYIGLNNVQSILLWVQEYLDESIYEIKNKEKLVLFLELKEYNISTIFFIIKEKKYYNMINDLISICKLIENTFCFYIKDNDLISFFENAFVAKSDNLNITEIKEKEIYGILYKNDFFDKYFYPFNNSLNILYENESSADDKLNALAKWINEKSEPLVIRFSEYYFSTLFSPETIALFIFYNDINELNKTDIIKCAKKHKMVTFAISGNVEVYEKRLLSDLLIDDVQKPIMRITQFKNDIEIPYKYKPLSDEVEINEKTIDQFINEFLTDNKYFYKKSERILPDEYNNGYVKIIVADNYDEHIFNNDKNVVVLYYAPWCGHCHKFDPIYRRIGKRLKLYINQNEDYKDDVIISKIDAANNEIYNVPIEGYPTIYLYEKSNKRIPIMYTEEKTEENLISWICRMTNTNINIEKFLSINLDDEKLFENYEEL